MDATNTTRRAGRGLVTILTLVAGLLLLSPARADDPWWIDDYDELACYNGVTCTFCMDNPCPDALEPLVCFDKTFLSFSECEAYLAQINAGGLGGGMVTPSKEYVHAIVDFTTLPSEVSGCCGASTPDGPPPVARAGRTRPVVLELVRTFRSRLFPSHTPFGRRWQHNYDYELRVYADGAHTEVLALFPGGARMEFVDPDNGGTFVPWNQTVALGAGLQPQGDDFLLTTRDGVRLHFIPVPDDVSVAYRPDWVEDRTGYRLTLDYDDVADGIARLETVTDSFGRTLTLEWGLLWGAWPVVDKAVLPDGREIVYTHESQDAGTVIYPDGDVSLDSAGADADGPYHVFADAKGNPGSRKHKVYLSESGQVRGIFSVDGELLFVPRGLDAHTLRYEYAFGRRETLTLDDAGYPVKIVDDGSGALTSSTWDPATGLLLASTDALGHTTSYAYEGGRVVAITHPDGTQRLFTWVDGRLATETDENGATTAYTHDPMGNVVRVDHPDGAVETFTYGPFGLPASWTDPLGHLTVYEWDGHGDLARVTLPDDDAIPGNEPTWVLQHDLVGRLLDVTDPEGRTTAFQWDAADRLVKTIWPDHTTERVVYGVNGADPDDPAGTTGLVLAHKDRNEDWTFFTYDGLDNVLTAADALGDVAHFSYAPGTRLPETVDQEGDLTWLTYDDRGRVATRSVAVDASSALTTTYAHDALDRVVEVIDPYGFATRTSYDSRGRVASVERELAPGSVAVESFTYDGVGNTVTRVDPEGYVWSFTYDDRGRLLTETDPLGNVTAHDWDADGNRLASTDPLGFVTSWTWTARGRMASETDATGHALAYTYTLDDQLASIVDVATGGERRFTYGCCGRLLSETTVVDGGAGDITIGYAYDGVGHPLQRVDGEGFVWTRVYDPRGRVIARIDPTGATTTIDRLPDGSSLDPRLAAGQGRLEIETDPNGHATTTVLDGAGRPMRVIDALGHATVWTRDQAAGNLVATTLVDRNGHATVRRVDGLGRLVEEQDALGSVTAYGYDLRGALLTLTDAHGNVTCWDHDPVGRRVRETLADGGASTYEWLANGWLHARTDPAGAATTLEYDAAGRLVSRLYADGISKDQFTYDAGGRLIAAASGLYPAYGPVTRAYDPADRLVSETRDGFTVAYGYDRRSLKTALTTPGGTAFARTHDPRGLLGSVASDGTTWLAYTYDAGGRPVGKALGNGTASTLTWDAVDRLTGVSHTLGGSDLHSFLYGYDDEGNRLTVTDASFAPRDESLGHDAADRLVRWRRGPPGAPDGVRRWTLDPLANWIELAADGLVQQRTHDAVNALVEIAEPTLGPHPATPGKASGAGLTGGGTAGGRGTPGLDTVEETSLVHDAAGRLLDDGTRRFTYGLDGRLAEVRRAATDLPIVAYAYDALGRRVARHDLLSGQELVYVHDGDQVLQERSGSGDLLATTVYGAALDEPVVRITPAAALYHHLDALLSTVALTDETGTVVERYGYTPYGVCTTYDAGWGAPQGASRVGNPYAFTGRRLDPATGLMYLRARTYAPDLGRFLQRDPLGLAAGPNLYAYAGDRPTALVDPTGELCAPWFNQWKLLPGSAWAGYGTVNALNKAMFKGLAPECTPGDTLMAYKLFRCWSIKDLIKLGYDLATGAPRDAILDFLASGEPVWKQCECTCVACRKCRRNQPQQWWHRPHYNCTRSKNCTVLLGDPRAAPPTTTPVAPPPAEEEPPPVQ